MLKFIWKRERAYEIPTWRKVKGLPVMTWKHKFPWSYSQFEAGAHIKFLGHSFYLTVCFAFSEFGYWQFEYEHSVRRSNELCKLVGLSSPYYSRGQFFDRGAWSWSKHVWA